MMGTWNKTSNERQRPLPRPVERTYKLPRVAELPARAPARDRVALSLLLRPDRSEPKDR